jgi:putative transposase
MPNYRRHQEPGGTYFFTVVAAGREPIFTQEVARIALHAAIQSVRKEHPFHINAWVLLPDHLHCIWNLPEDDADYPLRWAKIKRATRHNLGLAPETRFWQPRYWEHFIRNDNDLTRHLDYIHWNPVKHGLAKCAADWPYSTFHRFVTAGVYPPDWGIAKSEVDGKLFGD